MDKLKILVIGKSLEQANSIALNTFMKFFTNTPWNKMTKTYMENEMMLIKLGSLKNMNDFRGLDMDILLIDMSANTEQLVEAKAAVKGNNSKVLYFI